MSQNYSYRSHSIAGTDYVKTAAEDSTPSHRHYIYYPVEYE